MTAEFDSEGIDSVFGKESVFGKVMVNNNYYTVFLTDSALPY